MPKKSFEEQVKEQLKEFNREQIQTFAWRCAVRALPFLGHKGNFDFWDNARKQEYLYSIFFAIDIGKNIVTRVSGASTVRTATDATNTSALSARVAADASAATSAYAAYAAANAASTAKTAATSAYATRASTYAARASAYAAITYDVNIQNILLQDLHFIKNNTATPLNIKEIYSDIWTNFQRALEKEDCVYWGKLYQKIFDNNFTIDEEALQRRLNVPDEIKKQGAAAVGHYLEKLEQGAQRLNQARIIILGDKGAGKTSLARKLVDPQAEMPTDKDSTAGVDTFPWLVKDGEEEINVNIWDFAGHTVTHAVHQFFLSERCLYIMVYDGRTEERNRLEYWLEHMQNFGGNSEAIILVNQRDQHAVKIPINTLKEQYPIVGFYTFSIQDDLAKLEELRSEVSQYIQNKPSWKRQEIPDSYYRVKEKLEEIFWKNKSGKRREYISTEEFESIATDCTAEDRDRLLEDLNALGISLWYKNMGRFNTLVLNPEWISHGVYKIINWVSNAKRHALTIKDFATIFSDDLARYPDEKSYEFLFELMKHYELAYPKGDKKLVIPHLLQEDRPKELPIFQVGESLQIKYKADLPLPPNTISRFIVQHHQQIKNNQLVWRYGVVLVDGKGSLALIREEDRTISVSVKGTHKSNYLNELRTTLNAIFDSYKSERPELSYQIQRFGEIQFSARGGIAPSTNRSTSQFYGGQRPPTSHTPDNGLWLSESKIVNHVAADRPYFDDVTRQDIPLQPVVHQYKIEANTVLLGNQMDNFTQNNFNFQDCNIDLQGDLNSLAESLKSDGKAKEAQQLKEAAQLLEQVEEAKTPKEVKRKGIGKRLKRILLDMGDEDSNLHKAIKGIEHGIDIAQDIASTYNDVAQWLGMPQVPKPFLKNKG